MILALKFGTLFTLIANSVLFFQLWPNRKSLLPRILLINIFFYILWSLWIIITLLVPDEGTRIILTKIRQVTNPFILPTWIAMAVLVLKRSWWKRAKYFFLSLYILPVITSISTTLSVCGVQYFENLGAHSFYEIPGSGGLMGYTPGPLMITQFLYAALLILFLNGIHISHMFSPDREQRTFAITFAVGGILNSLMEFYSRSRYGGPALIQMSVATAWPMAFTFYYAVTRLELLNIKVFAHQRVFENLPLPVLTLTPRMELWDANKRAQTLFNFQAEDFGRPLNNNNIYDFIRESLPEWTFGGRNYQIYYYDFPLKSAGQQGHIVALNDVTEINTLNKDLKENNLILKSMNAEILKISGFNRKIHAVLSHDMTGVLVSINRLLKDLFTHTKYPPDEDLRQTSEKILQASTASVDLLRNILSWSHQETAKIVNLQEMIGQVLEHLSPQILEKNIQVKTNFNLIRGRIETSPRMLEAIFRNILSNAIKHCPTEKNVLIEIHESTDYLKLQITDQGPGVAPEVLAELRQKNSFKGHSSEEGYGLGLRFTLEFVEKLGGTIDFESDPSQGTKVLVKLPL